MYDPGVLGCYRFGRGWSREEVLEGEEEGTKVGKYLGSLIGSEK